jgi:hypothetical protein
MKGGTTRTRENRRGTELNPEADDWKPRTKSKEPEPLLVPALCVGWLPG